MTTWATISMPLAHGGESKYEYNFGHAKENGANLLLTMDPIAFLCHKILQRYGPRYRLIPETLPRRDRIFYD